MLYTYQNESKDDLKLLAELYAVYQTMPIVEHFHYQHKHADFQTWKFKITDSLMRVFENSTLWTNPRMLTLSMNIPDLYDFLYSLHLNNDPSILKEYPKPRLYHPLSALDFYLWKELFLTRYMYIYNPYPDMHTSDNQIQENALLLPSEYFNLTYIAKRYAWHVECDTTESYSEINSRLKYIQNNGNMEHQKDHDFYHLINVFGHLDIPLTSHNINQKPEETKIII